MSFATKVALLAFGLFVGILVFLELGRRVGVRQLANDPEGARAGVAAVEGTVFGLVGLLIAFTFSGAAARFDARRHLIAEEANAIGTAYLRLDLLPVAAQPAIRESFRRYLDSRLEVYRKMPDLQAAQEESARSRALQAEIWKQSVAACREPGMQQTTILLMPALNQMIDITTTRVMAAMIHPPWIIAGMLFALTLASSLLAGHGLASAKSRSWLHTIGFAASLAISVYVTLDLEYPRLGFIRLDSADRVLVDLRQSME